MAVPTLAYMGSSAVLDTARFDGARIGAAVLRVTDFAPALRLARAVACFALAERLLCQTREPPVAISSIVRPVSTDVSISATTSEPGRACSSRCFIRSHCGLSDELRVRTRANEP